MDGIKDFFTICSRKWYWLIRPLIIESPRSKDAGPLTLWLCHADAR